LEKGEYSNKTVPVGSFELKSLGLHDMSGNASEWCSDYCGPYPIKPQVNPHKSEGIYRVRDNKVVGTEAAIFDSPKDANAKREPKYWAGKNWDKVVGIPPHLPNLPPKLGQPCGILFIQQGQPRWILYPAG
jgi:hypothetical protein